MDVLIEFVVFFGKVIIVCAGVIAIIAFAAASALKTPADPDKLEVTDFNLKLKNLKQVMKSSTLDSKKDKKEFKKEVKAEEKKKQKAKAEKTKKPKLYVIDFDGDIKASAGEHLRDEITAVVSSAEKGVDEVLVRVTSPGGMVHTYGLAAAQLLRIKNAGLKLTIAVDKVAASGGYMMACTADKILAAPFAIVGSIGVLAQVPNFSKILKKNDIDYQEITAGEYKRTLSMFGEVTEKGKEKFTEQIQDTHDLFKDFVSAHRPQLDLAQVATGEYWYGQRAIDLKLVDELKTSDQFLLEQSETKKVFKLKIQERKKIGQKLAEAMSASTKAVLDQITSFLKQKSF